MKKLILLLALTSSVFVFPAERIIPLSELVNPSRIAIDEQQIYICDGFSVNIYSKQEPKLIRKFGRKGEGPKEFLSFIVLKPLADKILINTQGKILYFNKKGDFISSTKVAGSPRMNMVFKPAGERFVGRGTVIEGDTGYKTINLYDRELNLIKELYRQEMETKIGSRTAPLKVLEKPFNYLVSSDKIFIIGEKEFVVNVFDFSGSRLTPIKMDWQLVKFTEADKKKFLDSIKLNPNTRGIFDMLKKRLVFPKYFPAIAFSFIAKQKLYVFTWGFTGDKLKMFIFSTQGELLNQMVVRVKLRDNYRPFPMAVEDNRLYQLVDYPENEIWKLHISDFITFQ